MKLLARVVASLLCLLAIGAELFLPIDDELQKALERQAKEREAARLARPATVVSFADTVPGYVSGSLFGDGLPLSDATQRNAGLFAPMPFTWDRHSLEPAPMSWASWVLTGQMGSADSRFLLESSFGLNGTSVDPVAVPEPSAFAMAFGGLAVACCHRRRRRPQAR